MVAQKSFILTLPKLTILLVCFPVAFVMHVKHVQPTLLLVTSALAILGTVSLIGKATEDVAHFSGPLWGGFLNATFGNVTELIIGLLALNKGLTEVVRASITGSILGNLLLVLGGAMFYGGLKFQKQSFSRTGAHVNTGMLWVAIIILMVPSIIHLILQFKPGVNLAFTPDLVNKTSLIGAVLLLVLYGMNLIFSFRTHRFLFMSSESAKAESGWSKQTAIIILFISTLLVSILSEWFVTAIAEMSGSFMNEIFIGVIIVAIVGNAAEGMVAVWAARDNKMNLSYQVAMGSCLQVALLIAPIFVIASLFMGQFMSLAFELTELLSLTAAVIIASASLGDGESNWIEGAMFLAVYVFFALVFWYH